MTYDTKKGLQFVVIDARYRIDEDEKVEKVILETEAVGSGYISAKPRVTRTVVNDGIPEEKPGQRPKREEVPDYIAEIVRDAQDEAVPLQATVTELDRSDEDDMAQDDCIYFINSSNTDSVQRIDMDEDSEESEGEESSDSPIFDENEAGGEKA